MEFVSLAIGVVSLYNISIDVLNRVCDYKEFQFETQTTLLRYEASKLKLQNWAKALGICDGKLLDSHDPRLDEPITALIIQNILTSSIKAFDKVEYTNTSLRLPLRQRSAGTDGWLLPIDNIKHDVAERQKLSKRGRIAWATGGKTRLSNDVRTFEGLVTILSELVPPREPEAGSAIKCKLVPAVTVFSLRHCIDHS